MPIITKIIETETGHRLINYIGKCAHLHGHRYRWEVSVFSPELDHRGFVIDYGDLKAVLKETVDQIDHGFLFHKDDPLLDALTPKQAREVLAPTHDPEEPGNIFVLDFNPSSENLIAWMGERIQAGLPEGVLLSKIVLWETSSSFAERTYLSEQDSIRMQFNELDS